jgi:hypothetical protein
MILSCDENNIELQKLNLPYLFVSIENHIKLDIVSQFTSTIRNTTLFDEWTDVLIYFGSLYITYIACNRLRAVQRSVSTRFDDAQIH